MYTYGCVSLCIAAPAINGMIKKVIKHVDVKPIQFENGDESLLVKDDVLVGHDFVVRSAENH